MLRCVAGRIQRELIGVLTLSILVAPAVAVAQDKAVSLDELLHTAAVLGEQALGHRRFPALARLGDEHLCRGSSDPQ